MAVARVRLLDVRSPQEFVFVGHARSVLPQRKSIKLHAGNEAD